MATITLTAAAELGAPFTSDLLGGSYVSAQFLRAGDLVERKGHVFFLVGRAIASPVAVGRVQVVGIDLDEDREDGDPLTLYPFDITRDVMVETFTEV